MREEKEELRMEAYYYSFTPTGNIEIDQILSSVAIAGKAHHNTAAWADEDSNYGNGSLVDLIQNRANEAAKQIDALKSELEATKEKLRLAVESLEEFGCGGCYLKAILLIRKLLSRRKSLRRKVRVLKDISGMLQHGERIGYAKRT